MKLTKDVHENDDIQFCAKCGHQLRHGSIVDREQEADGITYLKYVSCLKCGHEDTLVFRMTFMGHTSTKDGM